MLAFGTSAFSKLVCLNDRPQRTEIRKRILSTGGGYDYHRSLRLRVQRFLVRGESMPSIVASIGGIGRESERNSVRIGLERLETWRRDQPGMISGYDPVTYESSRGLFSVTFTPDFGIQMGARGTAVHVWNTARPRLLPNMTYGVLSLFEPLYGSSDNAPDDLAILSLPDSELYRLSEAGAYAGIGDALATRIEGIIREVRDELGLPDEDEHPPGPQP